MTSFCGLTALLLCAVGATALDWSQVSVQKMTVGTTYTVTAAAQNTYQYFEIPSTLTGRSYSLSATISTPTSDPDVYVGTSNLLQTTGMLSSYKRSAVASGSDVLNLLSTDTWWQGRTLYVAVAAYTLSSYTFVLRDTTTAVTPTATATRSPTPTRTATATRTATQTPSITPSPSTLAVPTITLRTLNFLDIGATANGTCVAPLSANAQSQTQHYFAIPYTPALVSGSGGATSLVVTLTQNTGTVDTNLFVAPGYWTNSSLTFSPIVAQSRLGAGQADSVTLRVSDAFLNGTAYSSPIMNRKFYVAVNCSFNAGGGYRLRAYWNYSVAASPLPTAAPTASPSPATVLKTLSNSGSQVVSFAAGEDAHYWKFTPSYAGTWKVSLSSRTTGQGVKLCATLYQKALSLGSQSAVNYCSSNTDPRAELTVSMRTGTSADMSVIYIMVQPASVGTRPSYQMSGSNMDRVTIEESGSGDDEASADNGYGNDTDLPLAMPIVIGIALAGFIVLAVSSAVYRRRLMRRRQRDMAATMAAVAAANSAALGPGGGGGGAGASPARAFMPIVPSPMGSGGRASLEPVLIRGAIAPYSSSPISVDGGGDGSRRNSSGPPPPMPPPAYYQPSRPQGGAAPYGSPDSAADLDGFSKTGSGGGGAASVAVGSGPGVAAPPRIFETMPDPAVLSHGGAGSLYPAIIPTATVVIPGNAGVSNIVIGQAYNGPSLGSSVNSIPVASTVIVTGAGQPPLSPSSASSFASPPSHGTSPALAALRAYASPTIRAGNVTVSVVSGQPPARLPPPSLQPRQQAAQQAARENKENDDDDDEDNPDYDYAHGRSSSAHYGLGYGDGVSNRNNNPEAAGSADPSAPAQQAAAARRVADL